VEEGRAERSGIIVTEVGGLEGLKCVASRWNGLIFYSFRIFEPEECFQNRIDVV